MIHIAHKIQLLPNQQAVRYFKQAFGCARLAYNWGLSKWQEHYKEGNKKSWMDLRKEFNSIKWTTFSFLKEVTKCATDEPFRSLNKAFQKFFRDLKKKKVSYPKFKKKRNNVGSFYLESGIVKVRGHYLYISKLGWVKMCESIRFEGKINNVVISYYGGKYYASFSLDISQEEYDRTHKVNNTTESVGIDLGLNHYATLSNGLQIDAPKPLKKHLRLLKRRHRQLEKKVHPKTKGDKTKRSNNFIKFSLRVNKLYSKITNIRKDFLHKLTSSIIKSFNTIVIEDLAVGNLVKNHRLSRSLNDVSFYEFRNLLEYKSKYSNRELFVADRFYPSSKTCSSCGNINNELTLKDRTYLCSKCGLEIDRDYNASLNLIQVVGRIYPEFTPVDLTALLNLNNLVTSKVEAGIPRR